MAYCTPNRLGPVLSLLKIFHVWLPVTPLDRQRNAASRFIALLKAALISGGGHVGGRDGQPPEQPEPWGWHRGNAAGEWVAGGVRFGWLVGHDLYLEPALAYAVAQQSR